MMEIYRQLEREHYAELERQARRLTLARTYGRKRRIRLRFAWPSILVWRGLVLPVRGGGRA